MPHTLQYPTLHHPVPPPILPDQSSSSSDTRLPTSPKTNERGSYSAQKEPITTAATEHTTPNNYKNRKEKEIKEKSEEESTAVYCKQCQTWLNGPRQWEDHKIGKKHRKNVQRQARLNSPPPAAHVPIPKKIPKPIIDETPTKLTDSWLWLEEGKKEKLTAAEVTQHENEESDLL